MAKNYDSEHKNLKSGGCNERNERNSQNSTNVKNEYHGKGCSSEKNARDKAENAGNRY